jgi:hypothetical protein
VMVTTDGPDMPACGYLLPAILGSSPYRQCIKVVLNKAATRGDSVQLTAGFVASAFLGTYDVAIATKQSVQQNWLQKVWKASGFASYDKELCNRSSGEFIPLHHLDAASVDPRHKQKLVIMLFWHQWDHLSVCDEAKICDLRDMKVAGAISRGAIERKLKRMKLRHCALPWQNRNHKPKVSAGVAR